MQILFWFGDHMVLFFIFFFSSVIIFLGFLSLLSKIARLSKKKLLGLQASSFIENSSLYLNEVMEYKRNMPFSQQREISSFMEFNGSFGFVVITYEGLMDIEEEITPREIISRCRTFISKGGSIRHVDIKWLPESKRLLISMPKYVYGIYEGRFVDFGRAIYQKNKKTSRMIYYRIGWGNNKFFSHNLVRIDGTYDPFAAFETWVYGSMSATYHEGDLKELVF